MSAAHKPDARPLDEGVSDLERIDAVFSNPDLYTIADISMMGWVRNLIGFYGAGELVEFHNFPNVAAWLERGLARSAVQRGLIIPARS